MNNKASHTPTPWSASEPTYDPSGRGKIMIGQAGEMYDHAIFMCSTERGEGHANAIFAITAVNHHHELVTRLYNLKNAIEGIDTKLVILRLKEADETLKKVI